MAWINSGERESRTFSFPIRDLMMQDAAGLSPGTSLGFEVLYGGKKETLGNEELIAYYRTGFKLCSACTIIDRLPANYTTRVGSLFLRR